jgi:hypothetical protein
MRELDFVCRRGRELVSLELDGQLSELEAAQLEAHLGQCAACRAFRADLVPISAALRSAPLEQPHRSIVLPRRRHALARAVPAAAAAAAVALAVGLSTILAPSGGTSGTRLRLPYPGAAAQGNAELRLLRQVRRGELVPLPPTNRAGGRLAPEARE